MEKICPFEKNKSFCWHYTPEHGAGGRCGIKSDDNDIANLKKCEKLNTRKEKKHADRDY